MKTLLRFFYAGIFAAMAWITITASLDRGLFEAGGALWPDPWFKATLFDAYFAFLAVWLVMAARERTLTARIAWLVAVLCLGSFAIATYFLWALHRLSEGADWRRIFVAPDLDQSENEEA